MPLPTRSAPKPRKLKRKTLFLIFLTLIATIVGLGSGLKLIRNARAATTVTVTSGPDTDAANNDFKRIQNAINAAADGDTIMLSGTFDFTAPFAAAAWALGSDNTAGTVDDYSLYVPVGLDNVTFTAASLGAATIQGPGDLAAVNLEGGLFFDGGPNVGWTISNIRFTDFDLSIGFFATPANAFNNTKIINNYIRIARDLNATAAPADVNQNIGIHFSFGTNQMISGNTIEFAGDGVSDSANGLFSTEVGMQSNTSGGAVYDGLQITNNILNVVNAQSADPEIILGIWENAFAHTSNITVSGNRFVNLAGGNNPATNLQRGFRVTSHSSATTTVKYQNNSVIGANIGFQWLAGANFGGNLPVQMISNTIVGNGTGVLIQSEGSATLTFNRIAENTLALNNSTSNAISAENNWWGCNNGPGVGAPGCAGTANGVLDNPPSSSDVFNGLKGSNPENVKTGKGTVGNGSAAYKPDGVAELLVHRQSAPAVVADRNTDPKSNIVHSVASIDFNPWLVLRISAAPNTVVVGGTSTVTADLTFNSDNIDTSMLGFIPDGTPVTFAGVDGTVSPASTTTTSGKATSTFTGTTPGAGSASATVDMQTVSTAITVTPSPCSLTCPANITKSNDPNQCGAVVTYPAPTVTGSCGTVVCTPGTGTFYPVGTTTVTCKSNGNAGPESCSFTVTVNDTQPPVITCPANITTSATASCPPATTSGPVNFTPTATDNCGSPTVVCKNQNNQVVTSGQTFPVGTTTVTCTATDASGNTASCSFTVTAFSGCLQDDSDPSKVVLFNAQTGAYRFCCGGTVYSGTGVLTVRGCVVTISHSPSDRRVQISFDGSVKKGSASLQSPPGVLKCSITDKNTSNNSCVCQ